MPDLPCDLQTLANRLCQIVGKENMYTDEPMSQHTTFKIGGPADLFVMPNSKEELQESVALCRKMNIPYFILGRGSDLLVSDEGYRGVMISLSEGLLGVGVEENKMICQAGVSLKEASEMACELGLSGFEFACGIPGSVGGACFMNAGAYGGSIADILESVHVIDQQGNIVSIACEDLELGYRSSRIKKDSLIVIDATFKLQPASSTKIRELMDELTYRRESKQPLDLASAGSTFKRPEGHFAGVLIAEAGLQGYRVGDAAVSLKHAGFVVNLGQASASDVHAVIEHVQEEVKRHSGVMLQPEVLFVG